MYYYEFKNFFEPLMNAACPKTDALIKSGFRQASGGYIDYARKMGISVDHKDAMPNQGWHFIKAYLEQVKPEKAGIERITCGELLYWMAEVSGALSERELDMLAQEIRSLPRREANRLIKSKCFPRVLETVMQASNPV